MPVVTLYSLAWDNDGGCGCQVYATRAKRDLSFREALMSYVNPKAPDAVDLASMDLLALADHLDGNDRLRGARYTLDTHIVDLGSDA